MLNIGEEGRGVPAPGAIEGVPGIGELEPVVTGEDETFVCPVRGVWASVETVLDVMIFIGLRVTSRKTRTPSNVRASAATITNAMSAIRSLRGIFPEYSIDDRNVASL